MNAFNLKVSIVTVCYNSEKTIRNSIESVLNQTYENIEYIIIDGNSSDSTVDIIKSYEDKFDGRLRWVSEDDNGIYYAMNKGISMATGDLVGLLNSDDTYELDAVENMCKNMSESKYQILYGFARVFTEGKMDYILMSSHHFIERRMICHTGTFVTRSVYEDFGCFNTRYISVADYDFMIRMSRNEQIEFIPVYSLISNYANGGMSSSDRAYLDLIKLKADYNMIKKYKYYYHVILGVMIQFKRRICKHV